MDDGKPSLTFDVSQLGEENEFRYVGKSHQRIDALNKVTGQALYPGDISKPEMLHLKTLFAGRPHARIVNLDTKRAEAVSGVVAVFTAKDVPVNEYGFSTNDQPVLCGEVVRFEGDHVAVVVAESERIAADACALIEVVYDDLPVVSDPREAIKLGCVQIHDSHPSNILQQTPVRKGDMKEGFDSADVIVEGSYYLPMQEHAYLQPEAGLAYMDGDHVVVETAGQWAHHDQNQIAHALGLPIDQVRVIYRTIGGAFGGREDVSVQIILALAAWKTGRPVKTVWSREESIRGHCKRHQMHITTRWGATREGKLTAAEVEIIQDAGAYNYTSTVVLGAIIPVCIGVYEIPNVSVDGYAVYTNNIPGGAFRGFGSPQGIFIAEMQMDKLAEKLEIDSVDLRERNLLRADSLLSVGTPLPSELALGHLLSECASAAGWTLVDGKWKRPKTELPANPTCKRGIGLAIGFKNVGFSHGFRDKASAIVELQGEIEIEKAIVHFAGAELGQGMLTVMLQIAAEALNLPQEKIQLINADTSLSPEPGSASASRLTFMGGHAIIGAAKAALDAWKDEERPAVGQFTHLAPPTTNFDPQTGHSMPIYSYSPIAQAAEVDVDIETGQISILRFVTVVDVGRAVNPNLIEGQVEGSVAQGLGYSIMENFLVEEGITLTSELSTYLLPTILDMPEVNETIILENPESNGPWGIRGLGEAPLLAVAPAIASAIQDAAGVWMDSLPFTPGAILSKLNDR